ncbi:MAG: IS1595 family transposase [Sphingomonadaceae bacterium]|nr:IS1595 family transposase [Sphingomonadaceae bacterium]
MFDAPQFKDEDGAFAYVEAHLWPEGPVCPHCGNCEQQRIRKMQGKTTRRGLYKCNECRKPFTVRMGTIFESSHLALHLWLQVIHLMCASKKGISTRQIQRMLSCSMKTAWFLTHRIREAMRGGSLGPMGGEGSTVEIDETFIGRKEGMAKAKKAYHHKQKVLSLVDRSSGQSRSFVIDGTSASHIVPVVLENVAKESTIMTDQWVAYRDLGNVYARHDTVNHNINEYVRGDAYTNTVEGFFSIFKRGMKGIYQHCRERHLHRYLAEFDFRYSNREKLEITDTMRAEIALMGVVGKRLTYETTSRAN